MNEFDIKAADWDMNPMHWDRSEVIAGEIKKIIPLNKEMKALEYGAGTGITSFLLKDCVKDIILMDNSTEMVKIMNNKIQGAKVKNMAALNFDLEHDDYKDGRFDLIFTQMVLHHVADIETILTRFAKLLNKGGYIAIADLYTEDGSFHGDGFTGHKGFDPENLAIILQKNNVSGTSHYNCYTIERKISETRSLQSGVFMLTGKKE
jgi:tRNA (cmo5U34)-methyltransferase